MPTIRLHDGYAIKVSKEDVSLVRDYRWSVFESRGQLTIRHARRMPCGKKRTLYLQKAIAYRMGLGGRIGFKNGDSLDCRRSNLRTTDHSLSAAGKRMSKNNTSGFKGVSYCRHNKYYAAYITVDRKRMTLGTHATAEAAARAYDQAAKFFFGNYARTNFDDVEDGIPPALSRRAARKQAPSVENGGRGSLRSVHRPGDDPRSSP